MMNLKADLMCVVYMLGCAFLVDYSSHHFSLYHTLQHLSDLEKNDLFNVL